MGIRKGGSFTAIEPVLGPAKPDPGDGYCYLPLHIFCGLHLLAAKLRRADIDGSAGAVEETARIVAQIRVRWPEARIVWPGQERAADRRDQHRTRRGCKATGQPARRFKEYSWSTRDSWSCQRRVIAKAEWTGGAANPRFIVTALSPEEAAPQLLYEKTYCARGDMENRIKECQLDLFADRTSAATMRANQLRLWFASMPICCSARCGALLCSTPNSPRRPAARSAPNS